MQSKPELLRALPLVEGIALFLGMNVAVHEDARAVDFLGRPAEFVEATLLIRCELGHIVGQDVARQEDEKFRVRLFRAFVAEQEIQNWDTS